VHGISSRVHGDHGVENGVVAQFIEAVKGYLRGSYIWGQCEQFDFLMAQI
jgi:hypothetical protein